MCLLFKNYVEQRSKVVLMSDLSEVTLTNFGKLTLFIAANTKIPEFKPIFIPSD